MKKSRVFIFIALIGLAWLTRGLFEPVPVDMVIPINQVFVAGSTIGVTINGVDTGLTAEIPECTVTVYVDN